MRTAFSKNGGNLGASGSVTHGFARLGLIEYPAGAGDADKVFEAAIEAGAEDVESDEDGHEIWTAVDDLHGVARALEGRAGRGRKRQARLAPQTSRSTSRESDAEQLLKLVDTLEEDDDVQTVWGNYEMSDAVLEKLG